MSNESQLPDAVRVFLAALRDDFPCDEGTHQGDGTLCRKCRAAGILYAESGAVRAATPGSPLDPALHEDVAQYREYFTRHAARDGACSPAMAELVGDMLGRIENALRASAPALGGATEDARDPHEAAFDREMAELWAAAPPRDASSNADEMPADYNLRAVIDALDGSATQSEAWPAPGGTAPVRCAETGFLDGTGRCALPQGHAGKHTIQGGDTQ